MHPETQNSVAALVRARRATNGTNTPRDYTFSPCGRHLFFLGADASQPLHDAPRSTLYRVHLPAVAATATTPDDEAPPPALPWSPVVPCLSPPPNASGDVPPPSPEAAEQTKELALLRERMRTVSHGLTEFSLHPATSSLLLPLAGWLYTIPLPADPPAPQPPTPHPLGSSPPLGAKSPGSAPILDPKPSPDGVLVAFVRDSDLWVLHVSSGRERRLTDSRALAPDGTPDTAGGEGGPAPPRPRSCAVAEYVMQEEFDRFSAFWWSPTPNHADVYEILYLAVDQTDVPVVRLPLYALDGASEFYHYPRPGDPNAVSTPCVIPIAPPPPNAAAPALDAWAAACPRAFCARARWTPAASVQAQYPWAEYVVRAGWLPGATRADGSLLYGARGFWLTLLSRRQKRQETVGVAVGGAGQGVTLLAERAHDFWINVSDNLRFLTRARAALYTSERGGCAHLFRTPVPALGEPVGGPPSPPRGPPAPDPAADPAPLTAADDWVVEDVLALDEPRELVYYACSRGSPLERHVCVSSFARDRAPPEHNVRALTAPGFTHAGAAVHVPSGRVSLNYSSVRAARRSVVYALTGLAPPGAPQKLSGISLAQIATVDNPRLHPDNAAPWDVPPPELFSFPAEDGAELHGALYHARGPDGLRLKGPRPTVLVVYAGPHVQLVRNERRLTEALKHQLLASRGYAVAMVDGRGSFRRGLRFESAVAGRFGGAELRDQVAAVEYLVERGVADRSRIAVTGWSYGAFAAAMLLARWGELFRVAVCGAPVTRWEGYDAAYTERYLGLPAENENGYAASSVLAHADGFPDEEGRLMLVHSLMDENVHASHTVALVDELVARHKQHALVLFPRERHGLRDPAAQVHFETAFFSFLEKNL